MRVLWFTNNPMPAMDAYFGIETRYVYWMSTLLKELKTAQDLNLAVVTVQPGLPDATFSAEGVEYFVIGQPARLRNFVTREQDLRKCAQIVEVWAPDIIHVHGTERIYGLLAARRMVEPPVLINIQGLHSEILRNWRGSMTLGEIIKAHSIRELLLLSGPVPYLRAIKKMALRQMEILRGSTFFCGQTFWDQAHVWEFNPAGIYFRIGRILRLGFYESDWSINSCRNYRVFFTNARDVLRGAETLIDAVALLKREFPTVSLGLAGGLNQGSGYGKIVASRIKEKGLEGNVELLGFLKGKQLIDKLLESHVFAIASWTENESNSLCEAQTLGMPCVVSFAGGMPSMVEDNVTGLHFPPGDAGFLAYQLRRIFLDDKFGMSLGQQARAVALKRHDRQTVVQGMINVYRQVLAASRSRSG